MELILRRRTRFGQVVRLEVDGKMTNEVLELLCRELELTDTDYAWVTRELVAVARTHAQGRIISTLEGGYALSALGRSVAEHVRELLVAA